MRATVCGEKEGVVDNRPLMVVIIVVVRDDVTLLVRTHFLAREAYLCFKSSKFFEAPRRLRSCGGRANVVSGDTDDDAIFVLAVEALP
jgi:hypothetical protein